MTGVPSNELIAPYLAADVGVTRLAGLIEGRLRRLVHLSRQRGLLHTDDSDDRVVRNLLASLRLGLRLRSSDPVDQGELERYLLVRACRLLGLRVLAPEVPPRPDPMAPQAPQHGYVIKRWERPLGPVGGDAVRVTADAGGVWMLVADVTGHGRAAHLLAVGLEWLWDACLAERSDAASPAELAEQLDAELSPYLPESSYVEAAVIRAGADGSVDVLAAGGVRFVFSQAATDAARLVVLSGHQFGVPAFLGVPADREQSRFELGQSGEVVFGTDGLFDQPGDGGQCLRDGLPWSERPGCLFTALVDVFGSAVTHTPAHDDATVASLCRLVVPACAAGVCQDERP